MKLLIYPLSAVALASWALFWAVALVICGVACAIAWTWKHLLLCAGISAAAGAYGTYVWWLFK